jgi:NAD(P) transhydrogenase
LYAVGRQSNADLLNLEAAGVPLDKRGRIGVNEHFQTAIPHIYAAGDVIGFPALAATSMEQGRLAACHMFGAHATNSASLLPYGVYTIPEISMIGKTERQLTEEKIPYEVGIARYEELARGQILGDQTGRLKLLFDPRDLKLLGIHIIGEGATELVHIGQAIMNTGATIEYFRDTVFNYPTLAEAYKVAALNGLNKLRN